MIDKKDKLRVRRNLYFLGLLLCVAMMVLFHVLGGEDGFIVVVFIGIFAYTFWMLMWVAFAANKGYPEILGWLAFLGPLGVLVLVCLPDKRRPKTVKLPAATKAD